MQDFNLNQDVDSLPHLSGPAAEIRQVVAAHFLRDCPHVLEIGGHLRPVTPYLTHQPLSVLSIDPKTPPFEASELNGKPCNVRHASCKFQELDYAYAPGSYGLIMLGLSLRPFGKHDPVGKLLFSLIANARLFIIEYPLALERSVIQAGQFLSQPGMEILCNFDFQLNDAQIAGSPYASRRFFVIKPAP